MSSTPYPLTKRMAQLRWQNWLLEPVEWDESEWIPRQACYEVFAKTGLLPFLKRNGYVLACDETRLGECIARCVYFGRIRHEPLNDDFTEEDYEYYYFRLDDAAWEGFWSKWRLWADVDEEHPRVRELIRYCAWTLLDLEGSPAADSFGYSDSEDEESGGGRQRMDPYLQDLGNGYI